MSKIIYKLSYEIVNPNAYPQYYTNDHPNIAAPQVPEHCWETVEIEYLKYEVMKEKADMLVRLVTQSSLIRNVQMFGAQVSEWKKIS